MTTLTEGDLHITIPPGTLVRKLDDNFHGLTHCMKVVDFILELDEEIYFVEIKDPSHPLSQDRERYNFIQDFLSGAIDNKLKYKFRDSFLYEWLSGRANKPISYFVLIAIEELDHAMLLTRTEALKRQLPTRGPEKNPWSRPFVTNCAVFNLATWNKAFREYPITRVSHNR